MSTTPDRRTFVRSGLAGAALLAAGPALRGATRKPKLRKAVKYAMIAAGKTVKEKFELVKKLGFQGVEIDSPEGLPDRVETLLAQEQTGVRVHGVIDSVHWRDTLSHPSAAVRARGLAALKAALHDASFGADTVLLVPGVVNKQVSYKQCWDRSQAEVRKALPVAQKLRVKIAIEVVWNNFLTKPRQLVDYVDALKSPWVGAYFDCSNMIKYGVPSAEWVRKLGKRLFKFDFKGYSKKKGWVNIGEGDEDWPEVLKALGEVGYDGWATAEVSSGGEAHLKDVARRMNKILGLK